MAVGDRQKIECPCSCGAILEGEQVETEIAWETHVINGGIHIQEGHTVTVRDTEINYDLVAVSRAARWQLEREYMEGEDGPDASYLN